MVFSSPFQRPRDINIKYGHAISLNIWDKLRHVELLIKVFKLKKCLCISKLRGTSFNKSKLFVYRVCATLKNNNSKFGQLFSETNFLLKLPITYIFLSTIK